MTDFTTYAQQDQLDAIVEEFAVSLRQGQRPSVSEFVARYPEHADSIRELFPAVLEIELAGPHPTHAPARLGEYRIVREIGRGGMGVVYEAIQESIDRPVAIKVLSTTAYVTPQQRDRFRREVRAVGKLHHTNIVPVFGTGEVDGVPYYAMQFIAGSDLERVLKAVRRVRLSDDGSMRSDRSDPLQSLRKGDATTVEARAHSETAITAEVLASLPSNGYFRRVADLVAQAADALAHAHDSGVLHRDVKPSNLLLDANGRVWVTDFGLAKAGDQDDMTASGDVIGTPRFMAPERFRGQADARGDVYSLGATLYELITLRPAVGGGNLPEVMRAVLDGEPEPPRSIDARIPSDLETIVQTAMAKDRERRYPTAAALAGDLRRFLAGEPILARRPTTFERAVRWCRQNRLQAIAASLVIGSLIAGVAGTAIALVRSEYHRNQAETNAVAEREAKINEAIERERAERASAKTADVLDLMVSEVTGDSLREQRTISNRQKEFLAEVLKHYREFVGASGEDERARLRAARAAFRLGLIEGQLARHEESANATRQAVDGFQRLANDYPDRIDHQWMLAESRSNLAFSMSILQKYAESIRLFRENASLLQPLVDKYPNDLRFLREMGECRRKIGIHLLAKQRWKEVECEFQIAREFQEKLVAHASHLPQDRFVLGTDYCDIGKLKLITNKPRESLNWFQKAIDIQPSNDNKTLLDNNRKILFREIYWNRARAFDLLNRYSEAIEDWERAFPVTYPELRAELRANRANSLFLAGRVDEAIAEVKELSKQNWNSYRWVNFACLCSAASGKSPTHREQYANLAMRMLRNAVKSGYDVPSNLATNPELDSIRGRKDFQQLVTDLGSQHPWNGR